MSHRRPENFNHIIPKALLVIGLCAVTSCSSESSFSEKFGFTKKATDLGPRRLPRDNQQYMGYGQRQEEQPAYQAPYQAPQAAPSAPYASAMPPNAPYGMPPVNYAPAAQAAVPYQMPPSAELNPMPQATGPNGMPQMPSYQQAMNESGAAPTTMIPSYNAQPMPMAPAYAPPPPASMQARNAPAMMPPPEEKPSFFKRLFSTTPPVKTAAPPMAAPKMVAPMPSYASDNQHVQPIPSEDPSHNIYYTPKPVMLEKMPTELPPVKTVPVTIPAKSEIKAAPLPLTLKKETSSTFKPVAIEAPLPVTVPKTTQESSQESSFSFGKLFGFKKQEAVETPKPQSSIDTAPVAKKNFAASAATITPVTSEKPEIKKEKTASQNSFSFSNMFGSNKDTAADSKVKTGKLLDMPPLDKPSALPAPKTSDDMPWQKPAALPVKTQKDSSLAPLPKMDAEKVAPKETAKADDSDFSKYFAFTKRRALSEEEINGMMMESAEVTPAPAPAPAPKSAPVAQVHKVGMKGYPDLATVPQKPQRFNESSDIKKDMNDLLKKQQEIESSKNNEPSLPLSIDQPPAMATPFTPEKPVAATPAKPAAKTTTKVEEKPATPQAIRPAPYATPAAPVPAQPKAASVMPLPPIKEAAPARPAPQAKSTEARAPQKAAEPANVATPASDDPSLAERARMRAKLYNEQYGSLPAAPLADENPDSRNYR